MFFDDPLDRNALRHPDRPAIVCGEVRLTWAQLRDRTVRRAALLRARGVQKGDRVAILSRSHPTVVETLLAASRVGAACVPLNFRLTPPEWSAILADCAPRLIFVHDAFASRFAEARSGVPAVCFGAGASELECVRPLEDAVERSLEDLCTLIYTSGTTGQPKGAMHSHRNWFHASIASAMEKGIQPDSKLLNPAPLFHVGGVLNAHNALLFGITLVLMEEFDRDLVPALIEREGITHALLVPAMLRMVLEGPEVRARNLSSLRCIIYGASPIREALLDEAMRVFGCDFMQGYGMTETIGPVAVLTPADHRNPALLTSCGRSSLGVQLAVGAPGEKAEIRVRGECVMKGYWNKPQETREAIRDGWLHTGDIGVMDAQGYVTIVDRKKDMIVSGGENVYPREVESVLAQHPAVADCAAIGVPSDRWGEEVKAVVVLKAGQSVGADEILEWLRGRLAGYKRPRSVAFVESLPRSPAGKLLYRELREPYWKGQARNV